MYAERTNLLSRLHRKYIYPNDPAGILFGKALKTLTSMILSYVAMQLIHPAFSFQAVFMSLMIALAEAGSSYADRKKNMLISIALIAALSPIAIWAYQETITSTLFVFAVVFVFFYAAILGQKFISMNQIIALCLISPFNSPFVDHQEFYYALTIVVSGGISLLVSFYIMPYRPRVLLSDFLKLSMDYLSFLSDSTLDTTQKPNSAKQEEFYKEAHRNIVAFRLIPSNFNISPQKAGGPFAYINRLGAVLERILLNLKEVDNIQANYQRRKKNPEIESFRNDIEKVFKKHFKQWIQDIREQRVLKNPGLLEYELELAEKKLLEMGSVDDQYGDNPEWINTQHLLFELRKIHHEMKRGSDYRFRSKQLETATSTRRSFKEIWQLAKDNFKKESNVFRLAIQAASASAMAMFLVQYLHIQFGYWLVIFTLILIKPTMGLSVRSGVIRIIGTALGVLGAFMMLYFLDQNGLTFNILFFLVMGITVYAAFVPLLVFRVCMYTFSILLFYYKLFPHLNDVAYFRLAESVAAVGISIGFSFALWPVSAKSTFIETLSDNLELEKRYLEKIARYFGYGLESEVILDRMRLDLEARLEEGRSHFNDIAMEPRRGAFRKTWWHSILSIELRIHDILNHLSNVDKQSDDPELREVFTEFPGPQIKVYTEAFDILVKALQERRKPKQAINIPVIRSPLYKSSPYHEQVKDFGKLSKNNLLMLSAFTWHLNQLAIELRKTDEFLRKIY